MASVLVTCIFLAVLAADPANAKCKVCNATSWEECDGNMTDCSSGMSCVSVNSKLTELVAGQGKQTTLRVASGCADVSLCNMDLFANFRHTQLSIQIGCARPGENVTANGKGRAGQPNGNKCFGCVAAPSECTKTVDCCDEETMCISAAETVAGKNLMVSRGCATEGMCRYGQNISFGVLGKGLKGSVSCCKGNLCNSSAVLRDTLSAHFLVVLLMYFLLI
ncbi:hypothetical protein NFI96_029978 [Prochilodus magdalenae]|nr:hypothetical protein NFI96_029978 [Prochilodus magdalenae]